MLDIPEDSTLASRRHAAKGILMPRERDHPQHRSWVSVDERGHSMAWIYLACYLNGEANEFEYTTTVMWIYVNWNSWPILSLHKSLVRRRSEQSDAQSRKHSYHVPTEREDIYIHRLDDGRWDYPKLTKPAKPRTDAFFISQLANSKIQEVCRNHLPLFLVSKKLVLVQTNGFAVILLHRLEDVNHALLSMKM